MEMTSNVQQFFVRLLHGAKPSTKTDSQNVVCDFCGEAFAEQAFLDKHIALDHTNVLLETLRNAEVCTTNLIQLLEGEREAFINIHNGCLIASTVGTSASTLGTVLSVIGLIGIPMTLGASLYLTGVGTAAVVTGAATTIGTSVARNQLNQKIVERINGELNNYMSIAGELGEIVNALPLELPVEGHKCLNGVVSSEVGIAALRTNWTLIRRGLTDLLRLFDVSRKVAYVTAVKFLGAAARALSFIGVAFQAVEIASLVNEWNAQHPEAGAVDELLKQLRNIRHTLREVIASIE